MKEVIKNLLYLLSFLILPVELTARIALGNKYKSIRPGKPIFIVGVPRSGTTLLYSLLANDNQFYWLSRLDVIFPKSPFFTYLIRRITDWIAPVKYTSQKDTIAGVSGLFPPSEGISYWERWYPRGTKQVKLTESDFMEKSAAKFRNDVNFRLCMFGKQRLLAKQPAHSIKIRYFDRIFSDCIFIQITRDRSKTVNSLVRAKGKKRHIKFWGIKPPGWENLYDADHQLQAEFQYDETMKIMKEDLSMIKDKEKRVIQVKFEDLIENSAKEVERIYNLLDQ